MNKQNKDIIIGVIGLGYVGLPLAVELGKKFKTFGFDINQKRVEELKSGLDKTREISSDELVQSSFLTITNSVSRLKESRCSVYIVTVPTPITKENLPDLNPIESASNLLGSIIRKGDLVIYESTVYPGLTEEICVPILEAQSGLKFNEDFFCGYSPERINPGDKEHRLKDITKVISASDDNSMAIVESIYSSIIDAGIHKASSIKVAEMAKVIENTQRDINIALINEISIICDKLDIDVYEVLDAASTKWNFLRFAPGLVGGHCIGVDPYYLLHKASQLEYYPQIISSGRKINDEMPEYIARKALGMLPHYSENKILILGYTFKENCPDIRNTKVKDLAISILSYRNQVDIYDPWVIDEDLDSDEQKYFIDSIPKEFYDLVILAVAHKDFYKFKNIESREMLKPEGVFFDYKNFLNSNN